MLCEDFLNELDDIHYNDGLLVFAQTKARKKYCFNPTILKNFDEFKDYINILKESPKPLRERFILQGGHWICGDIQIDADGKANCLIIDSLGINQKDMFEYLGSFIMFSTSEIIKLINQSFPDSTIYFPFEIRQHDSVSCKMFSIDDLVHLFTVEKYLDTQFKSSGLFGYLAAQAENEYWYNLKLDDTKLKVKNCHLPLSLARTMQTRDLFFKIIPSRSEEEQALPVNKKKETAFASAVKYFKFDEEHQVLRNTRLIDKFYKLRQYNADYLFSNDAATIEAATEGFTLEGCRKKLLS